MSGFVEFMESDAVAITAMSVLGLAAFVSVILAVGRWKVQAPRHSVDQ